MGALLVQIQLNAPILRGKKMEDEYQGTVYSCPENYGLELIFETDLDNESYQFNILAVWREIKTGRIFVGRDSGCSCPSPFEDCTSVDELEEINLKSLGNLVAQLREAGISMFDLIEIIDDIHVASEKKETI
jgi:hypothetical protein